MKTKNVLFALILFAVAFSLTMLGCFTLAMIQQNPKLLILGLIMGVIAVAMFIANNIIAIKQEEKAIADFIARHKPGHN